MKQGFSRMPNSATQDTQRLDKLEPATLRHLLNPASAPMTQASPTFPPYTQAVTTALKDHLLNYRSLHEDDLDEPYSQEELCECNGPNNKDITVSLTLRSSIAPVDISRYYVPFVEFLSIPNAMDTWKMINPKLSYVTSVSFLRKTQKDSIRS
jgi:hypothetical protein